MKTETKASEKWTASEYLDDGRWGILNESNEIVVRISSGLTKELAEKIVRAVNAHDALVEALEAAKSEMESMRFGQVCDHESNICWCGYFRKMEAIDAALALAKEGK